jgi:hypothetical protein
MSSEHDVHNRTCGKRVQCNHVCGFGRAQPSDESGVCRRDRARCRGETRIFPASVICLILRQIAPLYVLLSICSSIDSRIGGPSVA